MSRTSSPSRSQFTNDASRATRYAAIAACGFLCCQPNLTGMEYAFPRVPWHKVEPHSVQSSPSASSWSSPIRSRHNNPQLHPPHCLLGPWLLGQVSPNFVVLAISAGNQRDGQGATCVLIALIARKDCVRTSTRREPIAHWTKPSSRRCLVVQSQPQKVKSGGILNKRTN